MSFAGFKSEWATVKNQLLYVGGLGKEWTSSTGKLINFNPMWVKTVTPIGQVEHKDWKQNYISLRKTAKIEFPGKRMLKILKCFGFSSPTILS